MSTENSQKPYKAMITIKLEADSAEQAPELLKQALIGLSMGSSHVEGKLLTGKAEYVVDVVENQQSAKNDWQDLINEALKQYEQVDQ